MELARWDRMRQCFVLFVPRGSIKRGKGREEKRRKEKKREEKKRKEKKREGVGTPGREK